jgi:hypothetical protein
MKRGMVSGAAIVLTLLIPSTLVGWGPEGHEIVASLGPPDREREKRGSLTDRRCEPRIHRKLGGRGSTSSRPLTLEVLSSELRMVIPSARAVCIPDAKMPEISFRISGILLSLRERRTLSRLRKNDGAT